MVMTFNILPIRFALDRQMDTRSTGSECFFQNLFQQVFRKLFALIGLTVFGPSGKVGLGGGWRRAEDVAGLERLPASGEQGRQIQVAREVNRLAGWRRSREPDQDATLRGRVEAW